MTSAPFPNTSAHLPDESNSFHWVVNQGADAGHPGDFPGPSSSLTADEDTVPPPWDMEAFAAFLSIHETMAEATIEVKCRRMRFGMEEFKLQPKAFAREVTGVKEAERYLGLRRKSSSEVYNQDLSLLKNLAKMNGWELDLPYRDRDSEPNPNPLPDNEVRRALHHLPKGRPYVVRRKKAMVAFHMVTGLRPGEANRIDVENIIETPGGYVLRLTKPGKKGLKRDIPLPGHLMSPKRPFGAYFVWRLNLDTKETALWLAWTPGGLDWHRMSHNTARNELTETMAEAGVDANATRLRHTMATRVADNSPAGIMDACYLLGHRSLNTTQKYYVRQTAEKVRKRTRAAQPDFLHSPADNAEGNEGVPSEA